MAENTLLFSHRDNSHFEVRRYYFSEASRQIGYTISNTNLPFKLRTEIQRVSITVFQGRKNTSQNKACGNQLNQVQ